MAANQAVTRGAAGTLSRRAFVSSAAISIFALRHARRATADEPNFEPAKFVLQWGTHGAEPGEFDACVGVAVGPHDEVYTAEFRNERVQRFSPEGKFLSTFKVAPHAGGLAVDADGNVYVAHWNSNQISAHAPSGELLHLWGAKGAADGEFQLPGSIALGPDGLLYVPDQGNSRVQKFTREGKFVGKWGSLGSEPGQFGGEQPVGGRFSGPQFVAFDRAGNVYTTDAALDRVQKFTPEGELLGLWGNESSDPGGFGPQPTQDGKPIMGGPIGICVDRHDRVWVGATNHRVQQFTNDGKFLQSLGGLGTEPGQFERPHALALDSQGCLYVADTMNGRIQKFDANG